MELISKHFPLSITISVMSFGVGGYITVMSFEVGGSITVVSFWGGRIYNSDVL